MDKEGKPSMENFHPLCWTHSHFPRFSVLPSCRILDMMHWTLRVAEWSSRRTELNLCPRKWVLKLHLIYWIHLREIFCWPFYSYIENFVDIFCFSGHFLHLFGLVSPVMCIKIPLCTENSVILLHASHVIPNTPQNLWRNHTTMPDIFGIMCIFPSL